MARDQVQVIFAGETFLDNFEVRSPGKPQRKPKPGAVLLSVSKLWRGAIPMFLKRGFAWHYVAGFQGGTI